MAMTWAEAMIAARTTASAANCLFLSFANTLGFTFLNFAAQSAAKAVVPIQNSASALRFFL